MAERKLHVVLLSTDTGLRDRLTALERSGDAPFELIYSGGAAGRIPEDVLELLRHAPPGILVLDFGPDAAAGLESARRLSEIAPGSHFVAVGPALDSGALMAAMRAGITEYLPRPVTPDELAAAVLRAARRLHAALDPVPQRPGRVWAFLSAKGGVGATSAAVNVAVALHRSTQESTLLADLDFELGGLALLLGIHPRFSFLDVARNLHRLDAGLLNSYLERHESGLRVLAAPARPERSDAVSAEDASRILGFLRKLYRYVLLDVSRSLSPMTLGVLQEADLIVTVTTPDLPSLGSLKRILPVLRRLDGKGGDRLRVVLNRYQADGPVTIDDVRTLLDMDVHWTLRNDYRTVSRAANEGKPVVLNGRSPYAQDVTAMVAALANGAADPEIGSSPLRRLLRFWARE